MSLDKAVYSARHARRLEKQAEEQRVLESGTLVMRDAQNKVVGITDDGLKVVERLAASGRPLRLIASKLGTTLTTFEKLMGKADTNPPTPARLAYERGHAQSEDSYRKLLWRHAKKNPIAAIFLGKAIYGLKDSGMTVDIKEDKRIQLVLPKATSLEEYLKKLGMDGPMDFRKDKSKPHPLLKDVTPSVPHGLPAPKMEATAYPAGKYPRSKAAWMKSQGHWNPSIHEEE